MLGNSEDKFKFVTCLSNNIKSAIAKQMRTLLILLLQLGLSHVQQSGPGSMQCALRLTSIIALLSRVRPAPSSPWLRLGQALCTENSVVISLQAVSSRTCMRGGKIAPFTVILAFSSILSARLCRNIKSSLSVVSNKHPYTPPSKEMLS